MNSLIWLRTGNLLLISPAIVEKSSALADKLHSLSFKRLTSLDVFGYYLSAILLPYGYDDPSIISTFIQGFLFVIIDG
jgi:hypothetical protein